MKRISDALWAMYQSIESSSALCIPVKVRDEYGVTYRIHSVRSFPWECFSPYFLWAIVGMLRAKWQLRKYHQIEVSAGLTFDKCEGISYGFGKLRTFRSVHLCLTIISTNPQLNGEFDIFEERIRPYASVWDLSEKQSDSTGRHRKRPTH